MSRPHSTGMGRLKQALVGTAGIVIGIVTLRRFRNRKTDPREEAEIAAKEAIDEASKAAEHTAESLKHARVAGEKTVEYTTEELEDVRETVAEKPSRLRRVRNKIPIRRR